jgi:AcrR family transcriptional regulator
VTTRTFPTHPDAQRSLSTRRHPPAGKRGNRAVIPFDAEAEFDWLVTGLASLIQPRSSTSRPPTTSQGQVVTCPQVMASAPMIYQHALSLIDQEGVRALNMRRLADELQISTRTFYKRIGSRDHLIRNVLQLHGSRLTLELPDGGTMEFRSWAWCVSLRAALRAHPHLTELMQDDKPAMLYEPIGQLVNAAVQEGVPAALAERFAWSLANVTIDEALREVATLRGTTISPQTNLDPIKSSKVSEDLRSDRAGICARGDEVGKEISLMAQRNSRQSRHITTKTSSPRGALRSAEKRQPSAGQ